MLYGHFSKLWWFWWKYIASIKKKKKQPAQNHNIVKSFQDCDESSPVKSDTLKTRTPLNRLLALTWRMCTSHQCFFAAEHMIYSLGKEHVLKNFPFSTESVENSFIFWGWFNRNLWNEEMS